MRPNAGGGCGVWLEVKQVTEVGGAVSSGATFEIRPNADYPERGDGHGYLEARCSFWVVHMGFDAVRVTERS